MHDLEFRPATPFLATKLADDSGYIAAMNLARYGADSVPELTTALSSPNPATRIHAAYAVELSTEPGLVSKIHDLLSDPEPEVRQHAIRAAGRRWKPERRESLIWFLNDTNADVCAEARKIFISAETNGLAKFIPDFFTMLRGNNPGGQTSGYDMLKRLNVPIPRADLLNLFQAPDAFSLAYAELRRKGPLTCEEALPLLHHHSELARIIALNILRNNPERQSITLALPLLRDSDPRVQKRAGDTLHALTGENFPADQPDQWEQWWSTNRASFTVVQPAAKP